MINTPAFLILYKHTFFLGVGAVRSTIGTISMALLSARLREHRIYLSMFTVLEAEHEAGGERAKTYSHSVAFFLFLD